MGATQALGDIKQTGNEYGGFSPFEFARSFEMLGFLVLTCFTNREILMPDNIHGKDEGLFLRSANSGCSGVKSTVATLLFFFFVFGIIGMVLKAFGLMK